MNQQTDQDVSDNSPIGEPLRCLPIEGKRWIERGWGLFKYSWLEFLLAFAIMLLVQLLLNNIPLLGGLLTYLLMPILTAGFIQMAHHAQHDESVGLGDLLVAFGTRLSGRQGQLLKLGVVSIVFNILLGVALVMAITITVQPDSLPNLNELSAMSASQQQQVLEQLIAGVMAGIGEHGIELLMLVVAAASLGVLYGCAMWLAVPLVWLSHQSAWQAMNHSFVACKNNIWPLTVFSLLAGGICLLAAIPLGLGLLVALPVVTLSSYAAYLHIYATTADSDQPTVML